MTAPSLLHRLTNPLLMWILVFFGATLAWALLPHVELWAHSFWGFGLAILCGAYWIVMMLGALKVNEQVAQSVASNTSFTDQGAYRYIRHPMYAGDIVLMIGVIMARPLEWVVAAAVWAAFIFLLWMLLEEQGLRERFGQSYLDYMKRVPLLLPRWHRTH